MFKVGTDAVEFEVLLVTIVVLVDRIVVLVLLAVLLLWLVVLIIEFVFVVAAGTEVMLATVVFWVYEATNRLMKMRALIIIIFKL